MENKTWLYKHKTDSGDMKASIAGIDFIISSATKHNVEPETLSDELQQLGLPKGWCFTVLFERFLF